jgi:hypothetical protein
MANQEPISNTPTPTRNPVRERKEKELRAMYSMIEKACPRKKEGPKISLLPLLQIRQPLN